MIRILFLIHDLGEGGAEKVLVNLVNNMNHDKFDITVIALFGGGVNEQYLSPKVHYEIIYSKCPPGNSRMMKILSPRQLHQMYVKEHYDIEVSYLEGPSARIISGCPDKDTKLISWIHGEQHIKEAAAKAFRGYEEAVECYQRYDRTVCVSVSVKEDFQRLFPMVQNVGVLYNTNETGLILEKKDEDVEEGVFTEGEFRICGVGKIVPVKGFDKLARIHKRLREEGYPVHTYILGIGSEKDKIETYINENGLEQSFTFLGYQSNPYKYVARCNLFVCASSSEGFSTAATEALIVGTPVVTTPVAGMKEMLGENNEYGIITEMSEDSLYKCIRRLLDEPELLKHYREKAVIREKDFSVEKTVMDTERFLEGIVGKYL